VLLYLHGFGSGPGSAKAQHLSRRFAAAGAPLQLSDLTPGEDGFERSSPSSMLAEAERLLAGGRPPHGIIGSSLGGYLAAVAAGRNPAIERLVLLAPAFRLFERWDRKLTVADREEWRARGRETYHFASQRSRQLGWQFHEDAKGYPAFPEVKIPTLCIAGRRDETVPLEDVAAFVARTPSARLLEVDDGHELSSSLDLIFEEAWRFLAPVREAGPGERRPRAP
jgi:pimeloyl-ACP methyl ester carboxylesterase